MATDYRQPQEMPPPASVTTSPVGFIRQLSWGALFAGVIVAVAIQLSLALLGIATGLTPVWPRAGQPPATFTIGAGIWWLVTSLVSLFVGGWVAARMSGSIRRAEGMLHGLGTWAAAAVFAALIMTTGPAQLMGGSAGLVGQYLSQDTQRQSPASELIERAQDWLGMDQPGRPQPAEHAPRNLSRAAWFGFLGLLLGAAAATGGGLVAVPRPPARLSAAEEQRRRAA